MQLTVLQDLRITEENQPLTHHGNPIGAIVPGVFYRAGDVITVTAQEARALRDTFPAYFEAH